MFPERFRNITRSTWTLRLSVSSAVCPVLFSNARTGGETNAALIEVIKFNFSTLRGSAFAGFLEQNFSNRNFQICCSLVRGGVEPNEQIARYRH